MEFSAGSVVTVYKAQFLKGIFRMGGGDDDFLKATKRRPGRKCKITTRSASPKNITNSLSTPTVNLCKLLQKN